MDKKVFIAVDLGAESGRVFLGELYGSKLRIHEAHRFLNDYIIINGRKRWQILNLFKEIKLGLAAAIKLSDSKIYGIGIDTWGVDFGLFDCDGDISMLPYQYRDEKFTGASSEVYNSVMGKEELFKIAGIQTMDINSLFQLYTAKKYNKSALKNADRLLFIPDIFNYWLTGVMKTEYTIASTSQMLDVYKKNWSKEITDKLSIPFDMLPEINNTGDLLAPITDEIKAEIGADYNIPVFSVPEHDTASAVVSVPFENDNSAFISCGTWSLMGMELKQPVVSPRASELNYTNEGGAYDTIRLLKNISGLWIVQECRRYWLSKGMDISYGDMTDQARAVSGFVSLINPNNPIFITAGNMPLKIQEYCKDTGQKVPQSVGEIIRCVNDSLALAYRDVMIDLEELSGRNIDTICMVGGGIKNTLLSSLTADTTQKTVSTGPIEGTVIGNLLVQAIASGFVRDLQEAREIVRGSENINKVIPGIALDINSIYARYKVLP